MNTLRKILNIVLLSLFTLGRFSPLSAQDLIQQDHVYRVLLDPDQSLIFIPFVFGPFDMQDKKSFVSSTWGLKVLKVVSDGIEIPLLPSNLAVRDNGKRATAPHANTGFVYLIPTSERIDFADEIGTGMDDYHLKRLKLPSEFNTLKFLYQQRFEDCTLGPVFCLIVTRSEPDKLTKTEK